MVRAQSLTDALLQAVASPHPDGYKLIAVPGLTALVALVLGWTSLGLLLLAVTAAVSYAFRDPDRVSPLREGLVLAPADGGVVAVETVSPPAELGLGAETRTRVSIHVSLLDVHQFRTPIAGRVVRSVYVPGAFGDPLREAATTGNERRALVVETPQSAQVAVVQIASATARRIVTHVGEGESVAVGQRFGQTQFGARVDVYLPPGKGAFVAVGQCTVAGETVLGDLRSSEPSRDGRRG